MFGYLWNFVWFIILTACKILQSFSDVHNLFYVQHSLGVNMCLQDKQNLSFLKSELFWKILWNCWMTVHYSLSSQWEMVNFINTSFKTGWWLSGVCRNDLCLISCYLTLGCLFLFEKINAKQTNKQSKPWKLLWCFLLSKPFHLKCNLFMVF